jgi:hypothetical protein
MFLLLVTNKQSNILEDLDTLRLLTKVVPEYCGVRLSLRSTRDSWALRTRAGVAGCVRAAVTRLSQASHAAARAQRCARAAKRAQP